MDPKKELLVVALGENIFLRHDEKEFSDVQNKCIHDASIHFADLIEERYRVVITHEMVLRLATLC